MWAWAVSGMYDSSSTQRKEGGLQPSFSGVSTSLPSSPLSILKSGASQTPGAGHPDLSPLHVKVAGLGWFSSRVPPRSTPANTRKRLQRQPVSITVPVSFELAEVLSPPSSG